MRVGVRTAVKMSFQERLNVGAFSRRLRFEPDEKQLPVLNPAILLHLTGESETLSANVHRQKASQPCRPSNGATTRLKNHFQPRSRNDRSFRNRP